MKPHRSAIFLTAFMAVWLAGTEVSRAAEVVIVEAESGTLGTNFFMGQQRVIYISNTNNNTTGTPGIPARVASYSVTFPAAGTYDLYARARHDKLAFTFPNETSSSEKPVQDRN